MNTREQEEKELADDYFNIHRTYQLFVPSIVSMTLKFNRYGLKYPDHELENAIGYLVFTKPDMNMFSDTSILDQIKNSMVFNDVLNDDYQIMKMFNINDGGPFMPLFSNYAKNFDLSDESLKTRTSSETSSEWKVTYGGRFDSRSASTFSINFDDDRNLSVFKALHVWTEYINAISYGYIKPSSYNRINCILDYACSVYFFLTEEDGESILFYSKYNGVFPKNKPSSAFSYSKGEFKKPNYNVEFAYSTKKDYDPLILKEFNAISSASRNEYNNIISEDFYTKMGMVMHKTMWVETVDRRYKLRFANA